MHSKEEQAFETRENLMFIRDGSMIFAGEKLFIIRQEVALSKSRFSPGHI